MPTTSSSQGPPRFKGFILAIVGLSLGPAIALGLGRFAYALLLPPMRSDFGWSYASAGAIATANAVGYLLGAAVAPALSRRGGGREYTLSLVVTAASLLAVAAASSYLLILVLRAIAGLSGAVAVVIGASLVVRVCHGRSRKVTGVALGTFFGGAGIGIVLSGLVIPPALSSGGTEAWRIGWTVIGGAALLAAAVSVILVRNLPNPTPAQSLDGRSGGPVSLAPTFSAYALFGVGYMSFMTFIIAFLQRENDAPYSPNIFWILLGSAALASAALWGPVLARLRAGRGTAAVMAVLTIGSVLPILSDGALAVTASALLCGMSFLAVASAVTAVAGRTAADGYATPTVAALTVAFAVGQCVGPAATGVVADHAGGVRTGLAVSAGILALGTMLALLQRDT